MASPEISIVVPAHNASATLGAQLTALSEQTCEHAFEVLVVNNNSTDSTAEVARAFVEKLPGLRIISATGGSGVAYARNVGSREAKGQFLLFCDSDDVVRPGWIAAMAGALSAADLVGGVLVVDRLNSTRAQAWVAAPPTDALPTTMKYLAYATGANLGVRKEWWERLQGFDESYRGGHEEVDFAWRLQLAGGTVGFCSEAVVDYRLRPQLWGAMKQRFGYGRSYAQLYSKFADQPIRRQSLKREMWATAGFLLEGPGQAARGQGRQWLVGLAWTAGRWRGDFAYGVRCPL